MGPRYRVACAAVVVALAAQTGPARGSPLIDPFLGGVVFTGPTQAHATAIHYNPAAMLLDPGTHLYASGNVSLDRYGIDRADIGFSGEPGDGTSFDTLTPQVITPSGFVGVYSDFNGQRGALGFAAYTSIAQRFISDEQDLRYHTLGGHNYDFTTTLAGSLRANDWLTVGFGISFSPYSTFELGFAHDSALAGGTEGLQSDCNGSPCGAENPAASETYRIEADPLFTNFAFSAGFIIRGPRDWIIGGGYESPPSSGLGLRDRKVEVSGQVSAQLSPRDTGMPLSGQARVTYKLPQRWQLGARGPVLPDYDFVGTIAWYQLGRHESYDVRMFGGDLVDAGVPDVFPRFRGFNDVFALDAGLEGRTARPLRLGGRVRIETAAVDATRISAKQVEGFNVTIAGGAELRLRDSFALTAGYALSWYPPVTADPSAFDPGVQVACVDDNFPLDECAAAADGLGIPTAAGEYRRMRHTFTTGLRYDWF